MTREPLLRSHGIQMQRLTGKKHLGLAGRRHSKRVHTDALLQNQDSSTGTGSAALKAVEKW